MHTCEKLCTGVQTAGILRRNGGTAINITFRKETAV